MRVTISCMGRFHAFYLAAELAARGSLERLFTSYPRSHVARWKVPVERATTFPPVELLNRGLQRLASLGGARLDGRFWANHAFDALVAARLDPGADLFVGWSGASLASLKRARQLGLRTIVERGSTHILHQQEVLSTEYQRLGVRGRLAHPRIVEQELEEYELADFISVPTEFVASTFARRGIDRAKVLCSPYGVQLDAFAPPAQPLDDGTFRVIHCGNVSLRKGAHHLLEAFLESDLPGAELHFVGGVADDMRATLRRRADRRVFVHGHVPQERLVDFYQRSSVFCLASLEEGMAMVVPQAMACGLPVVATVQSGAAEVVRPDGIDGWLFDAGDVAELKRLLRRLHHDRDACRTAGASAARRVRTGFGWCDYGERITNSYRAALGIDAADSAPNVEERAA